MTIEALDRDLGAAERILLDTSALIAYHNHLEATHLLARHLLGRIEEAGDRLRGYFSVISGAEILVRPIRIGTAEFTFMHTFLTTFPNLAALPVDLTVTSHAALIRSATGLRLPDSIVIASAFLANCEAIVSNDEQWKRKLEPMFRDFTWIYLGDYR